LTKKSSESNKTSIAHYPFNTEKPLACEFAIFQYWHGGGAVVTGNNGLCFSQQKADEEKKHYHSFNQ
jgi:hypothetical protein